MSMTLSLFLQFRVPKIPLFSEKSAKFRGIAVSFGIFLKNISENPINFPENLRKSRRKSHSKMQNFANFLGNVCKFCKKFDENLLKFCDWSGAKEYQSDRSRQELSNEYLVAKIGFDTADNEPLKFCITGHSFDHIPSLF